MVVVGIVLLIIGAVLLFVPVVPQSNQTVNTGASDPYVLGSISGYSLTGTIPIAVSWTSSASVTVIAGACSNCNGVNSTSSSSVTSLTTQTGTSGSFTINQPNGGEFVVGAVSLGALTGGGGSQANVTFKMTTALSTVGTVLLIVGILVLILGVVLKSKKAPAMAPAPAQPMAEPVAPAPDAGAPPSS